MTETTTKVLSYGASAAGDSGLVSLVLDPKKNLDRDGKLKSRFAPGEPVYLLLHLGSDVSFKKMWETALGGLQKIGLVTRTNTVDVSLSDLSASLELPHNPTGTIKVKWYGRSATIKMDGRRVTTSAAPVRGTITYSYQAIQYLYKPPTGMSLAVGEEFPVVVWAETSKGES